MNFLKLHEEYTFISNILHTSFSYEICGCSSVLAKGLKNRKRIFSEILPTSPHGLMEKFSCNFDEDNCMLEKCSLCKSSETIDVMKLDFSSDTDSGSEKDISREFF